MATKNCPKCSTVKDLEEFAVHKTRKDGHSSVCKECLITNVNNWRKVDPRRKINSNLKNLYDITLCEYEEILKNQNGRCAICDKKSVENLRGKLFVDHCHKTGIVRGLLCHQCNDGLGKFKDKIELLLKAAKYLGNS